MSPTTVEKHIILLARLDVHVVAIVEPGVQLLDGALGDGHQSLLAPLSQHAHELLIEIKAGKFQIDEFADAQSAREERLNDGTVAMTLPFREIDGGFKLINLSRGEHLGQMFAYLWRLEQLRRIVVAIAIEEQEVVERTDAAQDAALRTGMDADVVETSCEVLQILQGHFEHIFPFAPKVVEQFLEVTLIGVERVARHAALQLQVAHIASDHVLAHIFYAKLQLFFCFSKKSRNFAHDIYQHPYEDSDNQWPEPQSPGAAGARHLRLRVDGLLPGRLA